ncbi:MAG: cyclic nucleotide-binding protein [Gammaproteobacteria bacterium]|nr:cyclic nucleotide-binding protein [Gammaproteobacteria bacterium]
MAENHFKIAVVGSGPGGKSAAAQAAELGVSHVLLESSPHLSYTIFRYQKGKHVMDEPGVLPLRGGGGLEFTAGTREEILGKWDEGVAAKNTNVWFNNEVTSIEGEKGNFTLKTSAGKTLTAEYIVLGIGVQGNLRKLGVEGQEAPWVQYQLDDPEEYEDETIVVVGAGDAAIENAVALAQNGNNVTIINRRDEFSRAKQGNLDLILKSIEDGLLDCMYGTNPGKVIEVDDPSSNDGKPGIFVLKTPEGEAEVPCHRIIARLGGTPPRRFVENAGIEFPSEDPAAIPAVSNTYESNVPGLYIIGALAGYPLIKQCMNQGYEVIEFIEGRNPEPADEPLLWEKFQKMPGIRSVDEALQKVTANVPLLAGLTTLQLREFMLDSDVVTPAPGDAVFKFNDYTNTFFSILEGEVKIQIDPEDPSQVISLHQGQFFGEMSLISGRRRTATVLAGNNCVLIETPRRSMLKTLQSVESVKRAIDEAFLIRAIQAQVAPDTPVEMLEDVVHTATLETFDAGAVIFNEGDPGDSLHLIRVGSVTASRNIGDREVVMSYIPAGHYVGEMALLSDAPRAATIKAAVRTETIRLEGQAFKTLMDRSPDLQRQVRDKIESHVTRDIEMSTQPDTGDIISFLVNQGLGEATDVLLIDESLCVRCDQCEKACAETHSGTSRLDREAGPTFQSVHVPTSCRHCEHPHCMKDCPADAIHRAQNGEVFIDDKCIGCGNCQRNCPYGVIQMAKTLDHKFNLFSWLLFGKGPAPGQGPDKSAGGDAAKKAVKCDMCKDLAGGPACVRACPTGAALRVMPEEFLELSSGG